MGAGDKQVRKHSTNSDILHSGAKANIQTKLLCETYRAHNMKENNYIYSPK
jgi:hypothetical protein